MTIGQDPVSVKGLSVLSALLFIGLLSINGFGLAKHDKLARPDHLPLPLASVPQVPGLQLQGSWDHEQARSILDPGTREEFRDNIRHVEASNRIDTFLFVPTYAALLLALGGLGFVATAKGSLRLFTAIAVGVGLVALADWLENLAIAEMVRHVTNDALHAPHPWAPDLDAFDISISAIVKWSMLAVVSGLLGWQFVRARLWWSWLLGLAAFALAAILLYGLLAYARERVAAQLFAAITVERTLRG